MLVVHDGTANINKNNVRSVNMTKCSECKYGKKIYDQDFEEYWYICELDECYIPEDRAEDDTYPCDFYVNNSNDNTSKRA